MNKQKGPSDTRTGSIEVKWKRINREESIVDQESLGSHPRNRQFPQLFLLMTGHSGLAGP
jgi:hypothetical protein